MEIATNILNGGKLILFGLNEVTTTIAGIGLLTLFFGRLVVRRIIENIGFNSDSLPGEILSNIIEKPINKILDFCSKIFSKLQF